MTYPTRPSLLERPSFARAKMLVAQNPHAFEAPPDYTLVHSANDGPCQVPYLQILNLDVADALIDYFGDRVVVLSQCDNSVDVATSSNDSSPSNVTARPALAEWSGFIDKSLVQGWESEVVWNVSTQWMERGLDAFMVRYKNDKVRCDLALPHFRQLLLAKNVVSLEELYEYMYNFVVHLLYEFQ